MKFTLLLAVLVIVTINSFSQEIDSALARRITVSGFCLCKTTMTDLQKLSSDFKLVNVEEMDLGKRCMSGDSRYENGKGYYSEKYPGLIFQKDPNEDYISKIRLTKDFIGQLPDGVSINMKSLLLKDVLKLYPRLNSTWNSRGCSDYWNFSNDTISFYVKIDTSRKPQFPIDEAYYLEKPIDGIDIMMSCYSIYHKSENFSLFDSDEPMYFLDSIRVNQGVLQNYQPSEIALVTIYKDSNAIKLGGNQARNGLVYIITKEFARDYYYNYFRSRSSEYASAFPDKKKEEKAVYILNENLLSSNIESVLFAINDETLISIKVIDKDRLKKNYHISGKSFGVVIQTKQNQK
ncbi:MAG TPA: hypothetical protein VFW07_20615 [Parafilimonas sp.]|nr:hypothetical protein [Parafilimonas sp.]